mmetsp:Transcript_68895/g.135388  ORF Transcript_68895/g.135388 Transcript_68895/m.135388 type:complete len:199 (+) Transcript_68895:202-798(+)
MSQAKKTKAQVPSTESPSPIPTPVLDPPAVVAVAAASTPTLHPAAAATAAHDDAEQQRFGSLLATELQAALPAPSASSSNTAKGAAAAEEECSDKLAVSSTCNEILDLTQDEFLMLLDDLRVQPWGCSAASSSSSSSSRSTASSAGYSGGGHEFGGGSGAMIPRPQTAVERRDSLLAAELQAAYDAPGGDPSLGLMPE